MRQDELPRLTRPSQIREAHKLAGFDCGEAALNYWLTTHALRAAVGRTANTFVACRGRKVVGYYSLCMGAAAHSTTSAKVRQNTPDPIPATVLARLAVDRAEQGHGLGRDLMIDASRRVLSAARQTAARMLIVHPLHDKAASFYEKFGFRPLAVGSTAMYIPLATLADGL